MLTPLVLLACGAERTDEAIVTSQHFARYVCEKKASAEEVAAGLAAKRSGATVETGDITAGGTGKVVQVIRGDMQGGGVGVYLVFLDDSAEVEVFADKAGPSTGDDRSFVNAILNSGSITNCKPVKA